MISNTLTSNRLKTIFEFYIIKNRDTFCTWVQIRSLFRFQIHAPHNKKTSIFIMSKHSRISEYATVCKWIFHLFAQHVWSVHLWLRYISFCPFAFQKVRIPLWMLLSSTKNTVLLDFLVRNSFQNLHFAMFVFHRNIFNK